jgi:hypothetical protein
LPLLVSLVESVENLVTPLVEDFLEFSEHLSWELSSVRVLGLVFPLSVIWLKCDVVNQTFQSFSELAGELVENLRELSLLVIWALVPILGLKTVNEWFVDLVDDGIQ